MNRREFEHIIKACANATNGHEFLVIGSQAIPGSVPDTPRELRVSMELDVCPLPFTESAAAIIDGNIGELTRFHETFRIYAHAVGPETAKRCQKTLTIGSLKWTLEELASIAWHRST